MKLVGEGERYTDAEIVMQGRQTTGHFLAFATCRPQAAATKPTHATAVIGTLVVEERRTALRIQALRSQPLIHAPGQHERCRPPRGCAHSTFCFGCNGRNTYAQTCTPTGFLSVHIMVAVGKNAGGQASRRPMPSHQ